jgi:hypothetical protein
MDVCLRWDAVLADVEGDPVGVDVRKSRKAFEVEGIGAAPACVASEVVAGYCVGIWLSGGRDKVFAVLDAGCRRAEACDCGVDEGRVVYGGGSPPSYLAVDLCVVVALGQKNPGLAGWCAEYGK